jgi:hypothetical protein
MCDGAMPDSVHNRVVLAGARRQIVLLLAASYLMFALAGPNVDPFEPNG